jgi:CysZ protein
MNPIARAALPVSASLSGPRHLLLGYRLLLRPGVRGVMLIPLLGNIALYTLGAALALYGTEYAIERWLPASLDWLRWLIYPLLIVALLVLSFFSFTLLGNLLLAPFNGLLSERVERALTGRTGAAHATDFWTSVRRTLRQELHRLGYIGVRMLGVFALGFIPLIGVIALPLGLLLGAWLLALEFAGNPLGNWGWDFARQRELLRANRLGFLGFGFSAMGMSLIPFVNFAMMPAAVAGMTAYCLHLAPGRGEVAPPAAP